MCFRALGYSAIGSAPKGNLNLKSFIEEAILYGKEFVAILYYLPKIVNLAAQKKKL